eukprot:Polyplicarium_translucidae@DN1115_c0_g1_i1.p2
MPSRGCLIGTQTRSMRLGSTAGLAMLVGSAFLLASSTAMTKVATSRFGIPALHVVAWRGAVQMLFALAYARCRRVSPIGHDFNLSRGQAAALGAAGAASGGMAVVAARKVGTNADFTAMVFALGVFTALLSWPIAPFLFPNFEEYYAGCGVSGFALLISLGLVASGAQCLFNAGLQREK